MLLILGVIFQLAAFVCGIIILIAAFSDDVLQGILCLCVPFYVFYFVFARFQHPKKGLIIGVWLGAGILGGILQVVATMMAAQQLV
ncbi:MAG: hypothetical protein VX768_02005 [Planctomycetota bacterium]|nr:hypothetical protein [Planctomycetota bacterium]